MQQRERKEKRKKEGERKSAVMVLTSDIHGSTRNEQFDVRSKPNDVLHQTKQYVMMECALMYFVHYHHTQHEA